MRCCVEEYNPTLHYIPGPKNTIADTLSRLHCREDIMPPNGEGKNVVPFGVPLSAALHSKSKNAHYSLIDVPVVVEYFLTLPDEEYYLNLPNTIAAESPLNF